MPELEDASRDITRLLAQRGVLTSWVTFIAKIVVVAFSFIVSLAQFSPHPAARLIGSGAAIVVVIAAILLLAMERDASSVLAQARTAIDVALKQRTDSERQERRFGEIENVYDTEAQRLSHFQAARELVRTILEDVASSANIPSDVAVLARILTQAKHSLCLAHGFSMNEYYTICVYKTFTDPDTRKSELRCVAHIRQIECDVGSARPWREGVGAAGAVLARKEEIIIPDLKADELGSFYSSIEKKPEDDTRYRSIVVEPIWSNTSELWGAVAATSSIPGHFNVFDRTYVDVTQSLAGMMGLAVKIVGAKSAPGPDVP